MEPESSLSGHTAEYWRRVWRRAREETGNYAIEILTGVVGGSLAVILVAAGLYWLFGGWKAVEEYAMPILAFAAAVFICSSGFLFWRLVRLPPIMEREAADEHVCALALIRADHRRLEEQYAHLSDVVRREWEQERRLSVSPSTLENGAALRVATFGAELTVTATARVVRVVGMSGDKSTLREFPETSFPLFWKETALRSILLTREVVGHAYLVTVRPYDSTRETYVVEIWEWMDGNRHRIGWWPVTHGQYSISICMEVIFSIDGEAQPPTKYIVGGSMPYVIMDALEVRQWDWERQET